MNPQIRILIGTPAGDGVTAIQWTLSMMNLQQHVQQIKHQLFIRDNLRAAKANGAANEQNLALLAQLESQNLIDMEIGLYTLANESLLSRGRNHIAAVAIRQGWNKLFFIDADAQFTVKQFMDVALSPYDLCAGVCPLKVLPISLNYLPFEDDEFYHKKNIRSMASLQAMREGHKKRHIPVAFVGTAFMCISRRLLLLAAEESEEYQYPNPSTGMLHTNWNMFSVQPMQGKFMSEDWWHCSRARALGFDVMIDTETIINHVGKIVYTPEMANIQARTVPDPNVPAPHVPGDIFT